jgi:hypothetical protein
MQGMKPNDSQMHSHFGSCNFGNCTRARVVNVQGFGWKGKKHQIGPLGYHWKGLEAYMLKVPLHCSFRPNLCELWSKERAGIKVGIWLLTTNPLKEGGQIRCNWNVLYTIGKIFSRDIRYCPHTFKTYLIWEWYEHPKFGTIRVPVLGLPLGSPEEKWHLDVVPRRVTKYTIRRKMVPPPKSCRLCKVYAWGCHY